MKKVIVIMLVNLFTSAYACRMRSDSTIKKPETANTIQLLKIVPYKDRSFIKFESGAPWNNFFLNYQDKCTSLVNKKEGVFLFFTSKEIRNIKRNEIDEGDGVLVDINNVWEINKHLRWIIKRPEIPEGQANIFWNFCREDKDCTHIKNSCGELRAISINYQYSYLNYLKNNKDPKECKEKREPIKYKCQDYLCS